MDNHKDSGASLSMDRYFFLLALSCAVLVFIAYMGTLHNGFVNWDDNRLVYANPNLHPVGLNTIKWAFTHVVIASWYPLTLISLAVDYSFWALDPTGYHLTNNLLHAANTALVFIFVASLFFDSTASTAPGTRPKLRRGGAIACALVTALFFGLHPLRVESVAWVSERKDVLYAFFYLLALMSYFAGRRRLRHCHGGPAGVRRIYYILSIFFFVCSLMSKAMAVSLPLVITVIDLYLIRRKGLPTKPFVFIREKIPFFLLSMVFAFFTVFTHNKSGTLVSLEAHDPMVRVLLTFRGYIFYIIKTIVPTRLAPFYPLPEVISINSVEYLGSAILFLAISASVLFLIKKKLYWPSAVWGYYVLTLLPVTGLFQIGAHSGADRYTYLPSLGLLIIPGIIAGGLFMRPGIKKIKVVAIVAVAGLLLVSTLISAGQIRVWRDSVTLWKYEITIYPESTAVAYINLANAYDDLGLGAQAVSAYKKALEIDPRSAVAHNNLALFYTQNGDKSEALRHYAIALREAKVLAYIETILENTGDLQINMGKGLQAVDTYTQLIKKINGPGAANRKAAIYNKLGIAYASAGLMDKARESFRASLKLNPNHDGARENLKKALSIK